MLDKSAQEELGRDELPLIRAYSPGVRDGNG